MAHITSYTKPFIAAILLTAAVIAVWYAGAPTTNAQTAVNGADEISLYADPRRPGPNEEVALRAENYSIDIDRSEVSWYINGELRRQGIGANEFTFTTGPVGTTAAVRVVVRTAAGQVFETTHTIETASIDLLWHANTYTPPFYKGKALATAQSSITITAQPFLLNAQGNRIPPEQLIYTWRKDGVPMQNASGFGARTVTIEAPRTYQNALVTVEVSSANRQVSAESGIAIQTDTPQVVFYENHPLEGVRYRRALSGEFELEREELSIRAEPYFFPRETVMGQRGANAEWRLNNQPFSPQNMFEAVFRRQEGAGGRSRIEMTLQDITNLQQAANALFIEFIQE